MPSYFLGIDSSLRAPGVALVNDQGEYVASATLSVSSTGGQRLSQIRAQFVDFLQSRYRARGCTSEIVGVAREGFAVKATNRPYDLGMIAGVFDEATWDQLMLPTLEVPPTSLKKFATGNAFADKAKMLYTVKTTLGVDLGDRDDEADAVWLALFARAHATKTYASRAQADAVRALSTAVRRRARIRRTTTATNV